MNNGPFTKEEADVRLAELEGEAPKERCPLIGLSACMKCCVCFVQPYITSHTGEFTGNANYFVHGNCCGNGMFDERPSLQL